MPPRELIPVEGPAEFVNPHSLTLDLKGDICEDTLYRSTVVCFCDIPVGDIHIHTKKYQPFGLAFSKTWLSSAFGASPVFYVAKHARVSHPSTDGSADLGLLMNEFVREHLQANMSVRQSLDTRPEDFWERVWSMGTMRAFLSKHVFSFIKCFDENLPDDDPRNFYMEREWRVWGDVKFDLSNVVRLLFPEEFARRLRSDIPDYCGQVEFTE
jgi:hypothetical protein